MYHIISTRNIDLKLYETLIENLNVFGYHFIFFIEFNL